MMKKIATACEKLFNGQITVNKRDLWLIGALCLFVGIVYGLVTAPWTHGVSIGCHNGNNSGNYGAAEEETEA